MNQTKHRQVLDCASPLAFSRVNFPAYAPQSGRGLPHSTTLSRGCTHASETITSHHAASLAEVSTECGNALSGLEVSLRRILWRWELAALAVLVLLFNLPLLNGAPSTRFIFHPVAVSHGEWWRVLTHPFVHVSWYHLALDAVAFFLCWVELKHRTFGTRIAFLLAATAGSVAGAVVASPLVFTHGLCGLSGVAHGLTAVVGLELLNRSSNKLSRWTGMLCFAGVVTKSVLEATSGNVVFSSWHPGPLGTPIAACHAGGILGALCLWLFLHLRAESRIETGPATKPLSN